MRVNEFLGDAKRETRRILTVKTAKPYPTFLYKYRTGNEDFLGSIIKDSKIWLSSRKGFNDPMDIVFRVNPIVDEKTRWDNFVRICLENGGNYEALLKLWNTAGTEKSEKVQRERILNSIADSTGVYSMSETARSLLMWAHYANSHKGICLQFYLPAGLHYFSKIFPVSYADNVTVISHENRKNTIFEAFKTKSKEWHYEQEWRLLMPDRADTSMQFPSEMLKGVIYGALCPPEVMQQTQELIQERIGLGLPPLHQYQARLSKEFYHVGISSLGRNLPSSWTGRSRTRSPLALKYNGMPLYSPPET